MKQFIRIFKKVGGKEILRQYWRAHVLTFALIETSILGFSKKSLEIVRLAVGNKILCKMRRKYKLFIKNYLSIHKEELPRVRSNKVWVCWLQGIDKAPELVQKCYDSLLNNLIDREIILLTEDNYRDYIKFPNHIQSKIDSGVITKTHMSDLLRLELLNKYGGTWIDATVFCSGRNIPQYMLNSDLFLFQSLKPGLDGKSTCISSWFMSACTNHPILLLTQSMLYDYWKKNNKMIDYFLLHNFFQLAIETYPEEWKKVIPFSNSIPHILLLNLFEKYDEKWLKYVNDMTSFHKLSYKNSESDVKKDGTFYKALINKKI